MKETNNRYNLNPIRKTQPNQNTTFSPKRHRSLAGLSLQFPAVEGSNPNARKLEKIPRKYSMKLISK
jgi:hypothetical protein